MSTSKNFENHSFTPYKPANQKPLLYSTLPKTPTQTNSFQNYHKKNLTIEHQHFEEVQQENSFLREENKALKMQIHLMKGEFVKSNNIGSIGTIEHHEVNDLRETIKKEAGEIKELKARLEMALKQCRMYEEIIDKMEEKINKMTEENMKHDERVKEKLCLNKDEEKIPEIFEKVNQILCMYLELESQIMQQDSEWELWKEKWGKEKLYYLNRIKDLEGMMGIRTENKEFFKKRP